MWFRICHLWREREMKFQCLNLFNWFMIMPTKVTSINRRENKNITKSVRHCYPCPGVCIWCKGWASPLILYWTMQNFLADMVLWSFIIWSGSLATSLSSLLYLSLKENVPIFMVYLIEKIPWCGAIFTGFIFNLFQIINRLLMRNYDKFLPVASTYVKIK